MSARKGSLDISLRKGRKPWAKFTFRTDKGVKLQVSVQNNDSCDSLEEGLALLYSALRKSMGTKLALEAMSGLAMELKSKGEEVGA